MERRLLRPKDLRTIRNTIFEGGYFDIIDDRAVFKDPVTQEQLIPGAIPPCIEQDEIFGAGIRHLQLLGKQSRLSVHFLFGPHGSVADFDGVIGLLPPDKMPLFMGVESSWSAPADIKSPTPHQIQLAVVSERQAPGRYAFQVAQNKWNQENSVTALPCQPRLANESFVLSQLEHLWDIYTDATNARRDTDDTVRNAIRALAERSYQSARQWIILAQFGNWLLRLDEQGELSDNHVTIPITLGRWHARSQDRLLSLGISSQASFAPGLDTPDYIAFGEVVMRNIYECNASLEDLQVPIPY